jgi:hypothetical protein
MACACSGNATPQEGPARREMEYAVTLPNGRTEVVKGEHAARVMVTEAGGGTYRPR